MICLFLIEGCVKEVNSVPIIIEDQYRHYYPIMQGQQIEILYKVGNLGKDPLVLTDIHPSCSCIEVDNNKNNIIPSGKYITLKFKWDSSKNLGYTEHNIYLYGNIDSTGVAKLVFDTEVVPAYNSAPDYESYYIEQSKLDYYTNGIVNGFYSQRGYYINSGDYPEDYSTYYKKYPWLKEENKK